MKKIIILGSVSFTLDSSKVGINWIAEYLANYGYNVTYVSSASTPLDLFFKAKRPRFIAAWIKGGKFKIAPNLTEVIFKSPWLLNPLAYKFQHLTAGIFEHKLLKQDYDILISTVGALSLFARQIKSHTKILRLQDSPYDFGISNYLIHNLEGLLSTNFFTQIWPVSTPLLEYVNKFSQNKNVLLPNGISLTQFINKFHSNPDKRVVYVGAFTEWVDVTLIYNTARLLPNWQFELFGYNFPGNENLPNNVTYRGTIASNDLPALFANYAVGIIPFVDCLHIKVVERPLKFSQYLASGLGIASTDYGGLKRGMGNWASYGNSPAEFAQAIEKAYLQRSTRNKQMIIDYLAQYDWEIILNKMRNLLEEY